MEKQPIDDLFARKLREAELPPSPDAFSRLQSRMSTAPLPVTRRRVAIWWYGAAVASLLLVTLFYYRNSLLPDPVAKKQPLAQIKASQAAVPANDAQSAPLVTNAGKHANPSRISTTKPVTEAAHEQSKPIIAMAAKLEAGKNEIRSSMPYPGNNTHEVISPVPVSPVPQVELAKNGSIPSSTNLSKPIEGIQTSPTAAHQSDQQRVVVMTIEEPKAAAPIVALQPAQVESTSQVQSGSLAGLLAKVKQLKNGDALARVTPAKRPVDSRSRISRVFEGMKESLKNETTLE
ncbi:hypothetical protein J2I47_22725 [Fibrella sp. HMF5335]|uniref:Uncharacterized protein n=1 Tax=Fibrella rubiginis TaxID=2817060 RepID=A0A939K861_9BACT|nr:hypothetical protein [Fibrella rubiginis]MBO0939385.1 hypothetical protein [Fibrella rubiginis]